MDKISDKELLEYVEEVNKFVDRPSELCKCCVNFFKRENPTLVEVWTDEESCYLSTGMCFKCYSEANKIPTE